MQNQKVWIYLVAFLVGGLLLGALLAYYVSENLPYQQQNEFVSADISLLPEFDLDADYKDVAYLVELYDGVAYLIDTDAPPALHTGEDIDFEDLPSPELVFMAWSGCITDDNFTLVVQYELNGQTVYMSSEAAAESNIGLTNGTSAFCTLNTRKPDTVEIATVKVGEEYKLVLNKAEIDQYVTSGSGDVIERGRYVLDAGLNDDPNI